jgi:hypothetical protein
MGTSRELPILSFRFPELDEDWARGDSRGVDPKSHHTTETA